MMERDAAFWCWLAVYSTGYAVALYAITLH